MSEFLIVARSALVFLEHQYKFTIKEIVEGGNGGFITYIKRENGVAVKVEYDYSCAFVFVFIYRLENGVICENPSPISAESKITCFDFNDALSDRDKMKPAFEYGAESKYYDERDGLRSFVTEIATRLQKFGGAFLLGDFSQMPKIEIEIKRRAAAFESDPFL